ncbi:neuronal acetylcholine receptor subunit alpha-7 [Patella vulgata]|uniref:neuronal acetylcholine receptor subunit alpha-7 n=1 Tax=Patella vulgata TaxID=6465 RepID=UPI00217FE62F|nr:neuronal acetylcholine receptor subunit alpha-7 [Patella vulgata]
MGPILYLFILGLATCKVSYASVLERTAANILNGYIKEVRPHNADGPVIIKVGLTVTQLLHVNEKSQTLRLDGRLLMNWHDSRLMWDSTQYNGTRSLRLPAESLWQPDITLYNSGGNMELDNLRLTIFSNGMVSYSPKLIVESPCTVDQWGSFMVCHFKMGSWAYDGYSLDIRDYYGKGVVSLDDYTDSTDWNIVNTTIRRNEKFYQCCSEPYPDLTFTVTLRRRECSDCLIDLDVLPIVLVAILVPIQFLIPVATRERATFTGLLFVAGILVHLSLQQSMAIAQRVWQTDIKTYYNSTLVLIVISVIVSLFNIQLCSTDRKRSKIPAIVKKIFLSGLNYLVLVRSPWTSQLPETLDVKVIPGDELATENASRLERQVEHLIRLVQSLVSSDNGRQRDRDVGAREEWRALSLVIDRLSAIIFFIIFVLYTADLMG